jgi:hypothetical protein
MQGFVKKVGSLVLGIGALSLLLANAALTHGCGGARREAPVPQVETPPAAAGPAPTEPSPVAQPSPPQTVEAPAASAEPDCEEAPPYLHATKAPVYLVRPCGKSQPNAKQKIEPAAPANNAQQVR